jgi:hypothetical protein
MLPAKLLFFFLLPLVKLIFFRAGCSRLSDESSADQ